MSASSVDRHVRNQLPAIFSSLYSWGSGESGQLGHGKLKDIISPKEIDCFEEEILVGISAGTNHTIALGSDGEVDVWGLGQSGQLGISKSKYRMGYCLNPCTVDTLKGNFITQVSCGYAHSAALTKDGKVFTWGDGYWGQLGHGVEQDENLPELVIALDNKKVIQVSCGWSHTTILTSDGKVFVFGRGSWGDTDVDVNSKDEARFNPKMVEDISNEFTKYISSGGLHTVVITKSQNVYLLGFRSDSLQSTKINTFGNLENNNNNNSNSNNSNNNNQVSDDEAFLAGLLSNPQTKDSSQIAIETQLLQSLSEKGAYISACGGHHSLVLTENGDVYSFGKGEYGQLGLGAGVSSAEPTLIKPLRGLGVCGIACGAYHSAAVTDDGCCYVWGGGWYGQLGIGKIQIQEVPIIPPSLLYSDIRSVACGFYHTCAISTHYLSLMCSGIESQLLGSENEKKRKLLYLLLIAGGEPFLKRYHSRAVRKYIHEKTVTKKVSINKIFKNSSSHNSILQLNISNHILKFGVSDDNIFPISKKLKDKITIENNCLTPIRVHFRIGEDYDNFALNSDFQLSVKPSNSLLLSAASKTEIEFELEVNSETCNDIVIPVSVENGLGCYLIIKVKTSAVLQMKASESFQTPNIFEEKENSNVIHFDQDMRNAMSEFLMKKIPE